MKCRDCDGSKTYFVRITGVCLYVSTQHGIYVDGSWTDQRTAYSPRSLPFPAHFSKRVDSGRCDTAGMLIHPFTLACSDSENMHGRTELVLGAAGSVLAVGPRDHRPYIPDAAHTRPGLR